jgi:hypothetical protein
MQCLRPTMVGRQHLDGNRHIGLPFLADAPASAIIPATAGAAASAAAAATIFQRYQQRLAPATRDRQRSDLARFAEYLAAVQVIAPGETTLITRAKTKNFGFCPLVLQRGLDQPQRTQRFAEAGNSMFGAF